MRLGRKDQALDCYSALFENFKKEQAENKCLILFEIGAIWRGGFPEVQAAHLYLEGVSADPSASAVSVSSLYCTCFLHIIKSHSMFSIKMFEKKIPELLLEESIFLNRQNCCENQLQFMPYLCILSPFLCIMNLYWACQNSWPYMGSFPMCVQWFGFVSSLKRLWSTTIPRATPLLSTDRAQRAHCANPQTQWACLNG